MKEICPVCGSVSIVKIDKFSNRYRCKSCDEVFDLVEKSSVNIEKHVEREKLTVADIYKMNIDSIVEIISSFSDIDCYGTAFFVSGDGYLVTNLHIVVNKNSNGGVELCKECYGSDKDHANNIELEVVYLDKNNDLALLKTTNVKSKGLKLANNIPSIGENVVAIGNVKGEGLSVVNGIVGDTGRDFDGTPAFLFSAPVATGCSGGPIFNDKGEVCGVTVGEHNNVEGMKYGIPIEIVRAFLRKAEKEKGIKISED